MATAYVRNPGTNFVFSTDIIGGIAALPVPNTNNSEWNYCFYLDPTAAEPFYTSTATFANALAAIQAAYNLLVITLT
jgi:hypothetical protein